MKKVFFECLYCGKIEEITNKLKERCDYCGESKQIKYRESESTDTYPPETSEGDSEEVSNMFNEGWHID